MMGHRMSRLITSSRSESIRIIAVVCACLYFLPATAIAERDAETKLESLLKLSGAYCSKLLSSALEFTCLEEVNEDQNVPRVQPKAGYAFTVPRAWHSEEEKRPDITIQKNKWLFDYQMIRRNNVISERRTMLEENGKVKRIENTPLATHRIGYKELIMCPVGLLGPASQKLHSYRLAGKDKIKGRPVYIIEASPLPGQPQALSGRAWVDPEDGSVVKIEWAPESLDQYELIAQFGREISAKPIVKFTSEYGIKEKGIRFLSSHKATEAYRIFLSGKLFTRTKLEVGYRDFRFFTVETVTVY